MIEKNCEWCGKVMLLTPAKKNQRFCSHSCSAQSARQNHVDTEFDWKKFRDGLYECKYYPGGEIGCTNRQCDTCGWNPEVRERRDREIRNKMEALNEEVKTNGE